MRKNKMMRAASALMVAVLLTTCTISGTFAKYVTTASGTDTARVAKWGVQIDMAGFSDEANDLFAKTYVKDDSTTEIANTVDAKQEVVAPGTKNENGVTFSITGTPEVAVRVKFEVFKSGEDKNVAPVEVYLPAGTYTDYTKAPYTDKFTTADYYPVKFTLTRNGAAVDGYTDVTLAKIAGYLEGNTVSKDYPANTNLSEVLGTYKITWKWDFGTATFGTIADVDRADTYLGNVAAGTVTDEKAITNIDFTIAITAEQID